MKSSILREHKFRLLFQFDVTSQDFDNENEISEKVNRYCTYLIENKDDEDEMECNKKDINDDVKELLINFFRRYRIHKDEIDDLIKNNLKNWTIERMAKEDVNILRLCVYEMYYDDKIDEKVAINEAINLAKNYGNEKVAKLINGIIRTIYDSKNNTMEG